MWVEIFLEYAWKGEDCETTQGAVDPCSSNSSSKVRVLQVVQFWLILLKWEKGDVVITVMNIRLQWIDVCVISMCDIIVITMSFNSLFG